MYMSYEKCTTNIFINLKGGTSAKNIRILIGPHMARVAFLGRLIMVKFTYQISEPHRFGVRQVVRRLSN